MPRRIDGILVTDSGSDDIRGARATSLGAAYMEKPLRLDELEKTIQHRAGLRA
jgi:hypothetical protein